MFKRWIEKKLEKGINSVPAVVLIGPRQVGKTTLAQEDCLEGELSLSRLGVAGRPA